MLGQRQVALGPALRHDHVAVGGVARERVRPRSHAAAPAERHTAPQILGEHRERLLSLAHAAQPVDEEAEDIPAVSFQRDRRRQLEIAGIVRLADALVDVQITHGGFLRLSRVHSRGASAPQLTAASVAMRLVADHDLGEQQRRDREDADSEQKARGHLDPQLDR